MHVNGIKVSAEAAPADPGNVTPDWEVFAVRYGTRLTSRSEIFLHYEVYGEPDAQLEMDYYFWLIRSGDELVMVDTGFGGQSGTRRGRTMLIHPTNALSLFGVRADEVPSLSRRMRITTTSAILMTFRTPRSSCRGASMTSGLDRLAADLCSCHLQRPLRSTPSAGGMREAL